MSQNAKSQSSVRRQKRLRAWTMVALPAIIGSFCFAYRSYSMKTSAYEDFRFNIRLGFTISENGRAKEASSVIGLTYRIISKDYSSFVGAQPDPIIDGFAPMIELARGQFLFLTYADAKRNDHQIDAYKDEFYCPTSNFGCLPMIAYRIRVETDEGLMETARIILRRLRDKKGRRSIPMLSLPAFALIDCSTGKCAEHFYTTSDLGVPLAQGVALSSVHLEITDDPVSSKPQNFPVISAHNIDYDIMR